MSVSGAIDNLLKSSSFINQLKAIQAIAVCELQQEVQRAIYDIPASPNYERTFSLLNSITAGDLIVTSTSIQFKVYFDHEKMRHTSLFGSTKLGISKGAYVDIEDWMNDGFSWGGVWEGVNDRFHDRSASHFMEKAIVKIQADIVARVKTAINIEVRKLNRFK